MSLLSYLSERHSQCLREKNPFLFDLGQTLVSNVITRFRMFTPLFPPSAPHEVAFFICRNLSPTTELIRFNGHCRTD